MPLIKPVKFEGEVEKKGGKGSRPSLTHRISFENFRLALAEESQHSIEIDGRLLMLPLLYKEKSLAGNKLIHDRVKHGGRESLLPTWVWCNCKFARLIRLEDLGLSFDRALYLADKGGG